MNTSNWQRALRTLTLAALAATAGAAGAQADKSVVPEPVPAFQAFNQWVTTYVVVVAEPPVAVVQPVPLTMATTVAGDAYQPLPVIVGFPELPLLGGTAGQAGRAWAPSFYYQGLHMRQVVLDSRGNKREVRSMAAPLKPGERFKIRVTATFDAVAEVDQVLGDAWDLRRTGQVYPQQGMSVKLMARETMDLPMGANEFFVMNRPANNRLVVSVRHAKAVGDARSTQPAYRQDGKGGSSYLQLVPRGTFPVVEQLVSQAR